MAQEGKEHVRHERMVANAQSQTPRTLQLLWDQWEHQMCAAVLWAGEINGVQVDKPQESEEEYELAEVPAIFKMESAADAKDLSLNLHSVPDSVKAQPKSRMRKNFTYGSVRALRVMKLQ